MAFVYHKETQGFVSTDSAAYKELFAKGKMAEYDAVVRDVAKTEAKRSGDPTLAIAKCRLAMARNALQSFKSADTKLLHGILAKVVRLCIFLSNPQLDVATIAMDSDNLAKDLEEYYKNP